MILLGILVTIGGILLSVILLGVFAAGDCLRGFDIMDWADRT